MVAIAARVEGRLVVDGFDRLFARDEGGELVGAEEEGTFDAEGLDAGGGAGGGGAEEVVVGAIAEGGGCGRGL